MAVRADQANVEAGAQAQPLLFAMTQAGHVEIILGLHQGRSEYAVGGEDVHGMQRAMGGGERHGWAVLLFWSRAKQPECGGIVLFIGVTVQY